MIQCPDVLGRQVPWAFGEGRIKLLPHAVYDENAYYDRDTHSVCFGYYYAPAEEGEEAYSRLSYTCLSHDVITHELGHAILDGLKPYYYKVTSPATAGFHEYFGDAVCVTSSLENEELVRKVAGKLDLTDDSEVNDGKVDRDKMDHENFFTNIALELGVATLEEGTNAHSLRNTRSAKTMSNVTEAERNEEHDFSVILVGAYFDMLLKTYHERLAQLRLNHRDSDSLSESQNTSLRIKAVTQAAKITRRMLFRAIDYCPPVDLSYLEYAQAVYRADKVARPDDGGTYRDIWKTCADERGLCVKPDQLDEALHISNEELAGLNIDMIANSRTDAYNFIDRNRDVLGIPLNANFEVINLYRTNKVGGKKYKVPEEIVIEFVWSKDVMLQGKEYGELNGYERPFWCGGTLVFSHEGNLIHYALNADTKERVETFKKYLRFLIPGGWVTRDEPEKGLGSSMTKKVNITIEEGMVHIHRNSAMRCRSKSCETGKHNE